MTFFNPISFLLFLSVHSYNLFQMTPQLAKDLSGTYALVNTTETVQAGICPLTFDLKLISSKKPGAFVLSNRAEFTGLKETKPRRLAIDGQPRSLPNGQTVKGEVTQPNAIEVEVVNGHNPSEKLVEVFEFEDDGTLVYRAEHLNAKAQVAAADILCGDSRYRKTL